MNWSPRSNRKTWEKAAFRTGPPQVRLTSPPPHQTVRIPFLLTLPVIFVACSTHSPHFPGPITAVGRDQRPYLPVIQPAVDTPASPVDFRPEAPTPDSDLGSTVAKAARHYLGHRPPSRFRDDCSGFVCAVFNRAELPLSGNTRSLYETALAAGAVHKRKRPAVGDLVFFDDTVDRNRDGRWNDDLTHIAVVIEIFQDGTVLMAHAGTSKGRSTLRMNLLRPHDHTDESGVELNGFLRAPKSGDTNRARYLAAELWRAFATVDPEELERWATSLASR